MSKEFMCPYCLSVGKKRFTSWVQVVKHVSTCPKNTFEYAITKEYGPLHYLAFLDNPVDNYSLLKRTQISDFIQKFKQHKLIPKDYEMSTRHSKESVIALIKMFYEENNRVPTTRDWLRKTKKYPDYSTVIYIFKSWNAAIEAAGFIPNLQNGFGIDTRGLDKHLYRSQSEAYFADTYRYNKYNYVVEPKYPKPYNRYYDWYIEELGLYIELDGGCRPEVIEEKIAINKLLNRNCIIISTNDVHNTDYIISILTNKYKPL